MQLVALWARIAWTDRVSSRDSYQVGYVEIVVENGKVEVMRARADEDGPVSYTHLTLPTICSV